MIYDPKYITVAIHEKWIIDCDVRGGCAWFITRDIHESTKRGFPNNPE